METVRVSLGDRSYDITIGRGILKDVGNAIKPIVKNPKCAIVSNPTVFGLYGAVVVESLKKAGMEPVEIIIPDGEEYKSLLWAEHILAEMLKARLDRSSIVIALGGGVIGDITGFASSLYMRGVRFVQIPTTLLADVDSSVGGKTGVNHSLGKNMIGTFWQPSIVWIDIDTLGTLPKRQLLAGVSEVIKYGVIYDKDFFEYLSANIDGILCLDNACIFHLIKRACEIKAEVVRQDERESGIRAILNYGHTIGHAVETVTGYKQYLHGEAVAIGMALEAKLGELKTEDISKIKSLIDSFGLPSGLPEGLSSDDLISAMYLDKKTVSGELTFVVPVEIGRVDVRKTSKEDVLRVMA